MMKFDIDFHCVVATFQLLKLFMVKTGMPGVWGRDRGQAGSDKAENIGN